MLSQNHIIVYNLAYYFKKRSIHLLWPIKNIVMPYSWIQVLKLNILKIMCSLLVIIFISNLHQSQTKNVLQASFETITLHKLEGEGLSKPCPLPHGDLDLPHGDLPSTLSRPPSQTICVHHPIWTFYFVKKNNCEMISNILN